MVEHKPFLGGIYKRPLSVIFNELQTSRPPPTPPRTPQSRFRLLLLRLAHFLFVPHWKIIVEVATVLGAVYLVIDQLDDLTPLIVPRDMSSAVSWQDISFDITPRSKIFSIRSATFTCGLSLLWAEDGNNKAIMIADAAFELPEKRDLPINFFVAQRMYLILTIMAL